jgi:predicted transcriptional regulator
MLLSQAKDPGDVISINTIQSTIERLWKKQLLSRHKEGKAYIYTSMYSKQEVISSLIEEISDALGGGDDSAIMSGIFTFLKSKNTGNKVKLLQTLEQEVTFNNTRLVNAK